MVFSTQGSCFSISMHSLEIKWVHATIPELTKYFRLNTYIQTLPPPASSTVDPTAPPTITQSDDASPSTNISPLVGQSLPEYWVIETTGSDLFTISHLTSRRYLAYDKGSAFSGQPRKITLQGTKDSTWRISSQRLEGYSIVSSVDPSIAICSLVGTSDVNGESFVPDG
jgi:hypothetical protein